MFSLIDGKKVYLVCVATLAYAWGGWFIGNIDANHAMELTLVALTAAGFRSTIAKPMSRR